MRASCKHACLATCSLYDSSRLATPVQYRAVPAVAMAAAAPAGVPAVAHAAPVAAPGMAAVPAVAMAAAVPAVAMAAAAPPSSFLEQLSPSGQMWKVLLASAAPTLDVAGLLCGPWGDALRAAVLYEMQHPAWSREPRFVETGPVGQVIDFLADCGFESFVATAQHTEDTLKANPSQLAAPASTFMRSQALASAPPPS
ncbi:unnamed protein product [Symbiodinium microadriaticum]|nr:unnamed protein product [Symbiodinium microadriaticum]